MGPLTQRQFDEYLLNKYENPNRIYDEIHHYETTEVTKQYGIVVVPEVCMLKQIFIQFYDSDAERYTIEYPVVPVTNVHIIIKNRKRKERNISLEK